MYTLKQIPDDFIVEERSSLHIGKNGRYLYFRLTKRSRNTMDVVKALARKLHISEKNIGFAGNKDKHAVTMQFISMKDTTPERVARVTLDNVELSFVGYGSTPICLGDLDGNYFTITVRTVENRAVESIHYLENYFDEQRFSGGNRDIGKCLIQKKFAEALVRINNGSCQAHLARHPQDYVGALKQLSFRTLRLYVNAYQSYIWNMAAARYLECHGPVELRVPYSLGTFVFVSDLKRFKDVMLPLPGFGWEELVSEGEFKNVVSMVLREEGINSSDFIIRPIPELTQEGQLRSLVASVQDFEIGAFESDDLNEGKQKVQLRFFLPKGSYATMLIRKLFS